MRAATDTDFNKNSRYLEVKLEIYFTATPLTVLNTDYLVDADWLEEGSADSSSPFGAVSSNELSFRLFNKNGIFSQTNTEGPYFGKIKSGIPVKIFIRAIQKTEEVEWTQLGLYYVTGWDDTVTGMYVDVTANDIWYHIFSTPMANYPVVLNKSYHDFLSEALTALGYAVDVDDLLITVLPYAFVEGSVQQFLQSITAAALAYVTSAKDGGPIIGALIANKEVRATLTDLDQIKSVSAKQSITKAYDGVELIYSLPQVSDVAKLIELIAVPLANGLNQLSNVAFSSGPLWQVSDISVKSSTKDVNLTDFTATPWQISMQINNASPATSVDITVFGKTISLTEITIADDETKLLKSSSKYIQDANYATYYKAILSAFVNNATPLLSISIRGNPLLNIGDRVLVRSAKYNLEFSGIIQRMAYKYAGSLSCEMLLLNTEVLQGVSE